MNGNSSEIAMPLPLTPAMQVSQPAQVQSNVLARLHALFPTPVDVDTSNLKALPQRPRESSKSMAKLPKSLKVRIVTWNMHDSLPKGDLEELLGAVPPYAPQPLLEEPSFPNLKLDGNHPYHIVVVAGQECPSLSGIPMGLGAGFKLKDPKDKEREKDNIKLKGEKYKLKHKEKEKDDDDTPPYDVYAPSGWTSILEDWLCNGGGCTTSTEPLKNSGASPGAVFGSPKHLSTGNLHERVAAKEQWKGLYHPVIKHRMMGLYLTVYVHRDIRGLVRGTSKSAVAAGLIGGRVGNKGGIGISLNINGTTILLINAHLAAHEGKVPHRLANLAKIKAELSVDDFLRPEDPRIMAEDITDRFDYTFLFGDLNFRLDISRLHADWLISRQDYQQALAFDQLHNLMRNGQAFVGFHEGPINFAPTFKYDVLRTLKRSKTKGSRHQKPSAEKRDPIYEVGELDREDEGADEGERASMSSSVWTSIHSRPPIDADDDDLSMSSTPQVTSTPNLTHKITAAAAHKAKKTWMALLSPSSKSLAATPKRQKMKRSDTESPTPPVTSIDVSSSSPALLPSKPASPEPVKLGYLRPHGLTRTASTKSATQIGDEETGDDDDRAGVYDSSNKKRVPSWCDRILWKSTVQPDPEPEELFELVKHRTRMGQFFMNAFRPLTSRSRRESMGSTSSNEAPHPPPKAVPTRAPSPTASEPHGVTDVVAPSSRYVRRSKSNDILPSMKSLPSTSPSLLPKDSPRSRMASSPTPGIPSLLPSHKGRMELPPPVPPKDLTLAIPSRWRFFPFFNRDTLPSATEAAESPISDQITPPRRKGDVICLSYNTLDDRGMRRLEGRSDHRPVIGSYAVYI